MAINVCRFVHGSTYKRGMRQIGWFWGCDTSLFWISFVAWDVFLGFFTIDFWTEFMFSCLLSPKRFYCRETWEVWGLIFDCRSWNSTLHEVAQGFWNLDHGRSSIQTVTKLLNSRIFKGKGSPSPPFCVDLSYICVEESWIVSCAAVFSQKFEDHYLYVNSPTVSVTTFTEGLNISPQINFDLVLKGVCWNASASQSAPLWQTR